MSFTKEVKSELCIAEKRLNGSRAFVRDAFLSGGVISNPLRTYHLEFTLSEASAKKLMGILTKFGMSPKNLIRKGQQVVYLKEGDEIADCLKLIMAHKSLLTFEKMRVEKSIRENINRRVNFEAANLEKTIGAALTQLDAIAYISKTVGLSNLSPPLEEAARLRLLNPEMSLVELGALMSTPLGKSGVNHRFRKICQLAKNLRQTTTVQT